MLVQITNSKWQNFKKKINICSDWIQFYDFGEMWNFNYKSRYISEWGNFKFLNILFENFSNFFGNQFTFPREIENGGYIYTF